MVGHGRNFVHIDALGELPGVGFIDQAARYGGKVRVAQPVGAIGKSQFHRFGDDVASLGRVAFIDRAQIETFEHVEDLGHVHAAGTGRPKTINGVAAISADHRLAQQIA